MKLEANYSLLDSDEDVEQDLYLQRMIIANDDTRTPKIVKKKKKSKHHTQNKHNSLLLSCLSPFDMQDKMNGK